jgi:lycopene cyclase domain-containing protein
VTYTVAACLGVIGAIVVDLAVLRTRLLRRKAFWTAYAIVLFFQLVVNGLLTGLDIVRYESSTILGWRVVHAPVEDLLFGFAMATATLSLWVWLGRRAARSMPPEGHPAPPRHGAPGRRSPAG